MNKKNWVKIKWKGLILFLKFWNKFYSNIKHNIRSQNKKDVKRIESQTHLMIASQNMQWNHWLNAYATATTMQIAQWCHWNGCAHCTVTPEIAQQDHSNGPTDWEKGRGGKVKWGMKRWKLRKFEENKK